jgi:hypothetical protein
VGVVVILLIVLVAIGGAVLAWYLKQRRIQALCQTAARLGFTFSREDTVGCLGFPFALLSKGDGRGTENVMWGTWQNVPITEFDYWYYEESTDSQGRRSRSYSRFSCAVTEIDAACSHLTLARENLLTRLADHVGLRDIEFESEAFNRAFNVKSQDRKFANDLVDARMMRWLLGVDRSFGFEVAGRWILAYSRRLRPAELIPLLGTAGAFREHVPRVVYELYPVEGGAEGTGPQRAPGGNG